MLARSLWQNVVSHLVGMLVAANPKGAEYRRWTLIIFGGMSWALLAFILHPYTPNSEPMRSLLEYPLRALFAPDVFKHVLIGIFVFWFAYRAAAIYLDDIFELRDTRIAERFIRQSAFASQYDVIEIKQGEVAQKDQKSPIFLIGGPGKVRVYLENAALFEKVSGASYIVEPTAPKESTASSQSNQGNIPWTARLLKGMSSFSRRGLIKFRPGDDGTRFINSFERFRQVVDLRDQVEEMTVHGRTRDGIAVQVKNLRVIFSVYRDGQEPTLEKPYPFSHEAIETLVYNLTRESWTNAMAAQIRRELGKFIARHTLSEFLAAVGQPELEQATQIEAELQVEADQLAGLEQAYEIDVPNPPPFVPRPGISDLFYDYNNFVARVRKKGVELRWIGVGTWDFPEDIIPERHLRAWRITYENLARGNEAVIEELFKSNRVEQLSTIIQDTPIEIFNQINPGDNSRRTTDMVSLVNGYRGKLHAALEVYERRDESNTPAARRVRDVWTHLAHVVAHYAGDI
jgi:hypothetical protein